MTDLPQDEDRTLDADLGEPDTPDPGDPPGVGEIRTDWQPDPDDVESEDADA